MYLSSELSILHIVASSILPVVESSQSSGIFSSSSGLGQYVLSVGSSHSSLNLSLVHSLPSLHIYFPPGAILQELSGAHKSNS